MLPTATAYVYAGKIAGDVASLAGGAAAPRGRIWYSLLALGLVATIGATVLIARAARNAIDAAVDR